MLKNQSIITIIVVIVIDIFIDIVTPDVGFSWIIQEGKILALIIAISLKVSLRKSIRKIGLGPTRAAYDREFNYVIYVPAAVSNY